MTHTPTRPKSRSRRCPRCQRRVPRLILRCPNCGWTAPYRLLVMALLPIVVGGVLVGAYLSLQRLSSGGGGDFRITKPGK